MFRKHLIKALGLVLCGLLLACQSATGQNTDVPPAVAPTSDVETSNPTVAPTGGVELPNPAAVYCQEQGYRYEIRTAADGSQSGVCIFPDGSECDEWAFFRGECGPPQASTAPAAGSL
jgi:putative hemolysin